MGLGLGRLSALLRTGIGGGTGEEKEEEEEVVVLCRCCFLSSSCCCGFCWEGGGKPSKRLSPISDVSVSVSVSLFLSVCLCNLYVSVCVKSLGNKFTKRKERVFLFGCVFFLDCPNCLCSFSLSLSLSK